MQPELKLTYSADQAALISNEMALLAMPAGARKRILKNTGRAIQKASRERIKSQTTLDGSAMAKRKYGKGKVLKRMGKGLKFDASPNKVVVTWPNKGVARTAYRHQYGIPETFTPKKLRKIYGKPDYDQQATRKQAKALLEAGYTIKTPADKKGRSKSRKPTQKWIIENMTQGRAGLLIRVLRNKTSPPKRWEVKVPYRPFMGMSHKDTEQLLAQEIAREYQRRQG